MKPTKEILKQAKELCDAASDGPWSVSANIPFYGIVEKPRPSLSKHDAEQPTFWRVEDAKFHAVSRTLMPRLIQALEVAMAQRDGLMYVLEVETGRDCRSVKNQNNVEINQILNGESDED